MAPPPNFVGDVTAVIAAIPSGDVMTYGEIAQEAGFPGAARAVGNMLAASGGTLPWWRVVTVSGRLAPGKQREHGRLLVAEGVRLIPAGTHVAMATRWRTAVR
jgi:methylated-DNA-protein-cysteine methyltransferase-like protein